MAARIREHHLRRLVVDKTDRCRFSGDRLHQRRVEPKRNNDVAPCAFSKADLARNASMACERSIQKQYHEFQNGKSRGIRAQLEIIEIQYFSTSAPPANTP